MTEVSTHEVDELNQYEEINDDDLRVDVKIATLFSKMSKSEEERVGDLKADENLDVIDVDADDDEIEAYVSESIDNDAIRCKRI